LTSRQLSRSVAELALSKKAYDVVILDLRKVTTTTDYFIICSADSDTQVKAIANHIEIEMKKKGSRPWHIEGLQALQWILMDYVDIVVHIFLRESRGFYNLERLWGDAAFYDVIDKAKGVIVTPRKEPKKKLRKRTMK